MRAGFERFLAALSFFTRLPVPVGHSADGLDGAARYLPLVGVLVGALGALVTWAAAQALPLSLAVIAGMAATIAVTGAFHEDGLCDACDGFGGGFGKEQVLAIMKDPRVGGFGAIGIALMLLAKWNALMELGDDMLLPALVAGHSVSRLAAAVLMSSLDYVRAEGKSRPVARRMGATDMIVAGLCGLAPCLLLPWAETLVALAAAALVAGFAARYFVRRLGGVTGDCLGAAQQVTELAFYLGLLVQWNSG